MSNACYDTSLLQYSGTSQAQRMLPALAAKYAQIDERTTAQLILFAKRYGAYLQYYDGANQPAGNWQHFMSKDVSVAIAAIANWNSKALVPFVADVKGKVQNAATDEEARQYFKTLFDLVFTLTVQLDDTLRSLPADVRYASFLRVAIASNLAVPLATLHHYYTTFRDAPLPLITGTDNFIDPEMPVTPVTLAGDFNIAALSDAWTAVLFTMPPITLEGTQVKDDIYHILTHNLFAGPLQLFVNGIINIVGKTAAFLEETLHHYPQHEPHYALYLTFLRLFRYAQDHLNQYSKNHLDFYYKQVLLLSNRNAEPGFVHLLFELQKNTDAFLLKKDTRFKGGKDANNKDVFYAVTDDVVLQKATVASLQSLYLTKGTGGALYASPVANSDDGQEPKLSSADQSWFPFGDPKKVAFATLSFAVASQLLHLNEGVRTVVLSFHCSEVLSIAAPHLQGIFDIQFTGKKDWYTAAAYTPAVKDTLFTLTVTLPGDAPPVVPYTKKIHGGSFDTVLPVVQITLVDFAAYSRVKNIRPTSIGVQVSATVKNLSLQNNDGKIDAAKPFKPFGEFPEKGASLIIGSNEIFQKPLTSLDIRFNWQPVDTSLAKAVSDATPLNDLVLAEFIQSDFMNLPGGAAGSSALAASLSPAVSGSMLVQNNLVTSGIASEAINNLFVSMSASPVPANLVVLSAGAWSATPLESSVNLLKNPLAVTATDAASIPVADSVFNANEAYTINAIAGFVKLEIDTGYYSLATYLANLQKAMQQASVTVNYDGDKVSSYAVDPPKLALPAPELVANALSVSYTAATTLDLTSANNTNNAITFYHSEPFGWRTMHPFFTTDAISLLPVFDLDNGQANDTGGELWIGLKDAFADQTISLLFEVADGSANPLKSMTELSWYYLQNNQWLLFDDLAIVDQTNQLTRSGIVTITLPAGVNTGNSRAAESLLWIKLVAQQDPDAVCKLIAVRTNAAKATFVQDLAAGMEYSAVLPAGTISKPVSAIAAIKKTEQPYASFGGRLHEKDDQYYIRVSERLRHKQRAVTAWDYERLVLEYFPGVHKAKCIRHTGFITDEQTNEQRYSEVLPGHVMVVTVPDLKNLAAVNLLRPYTSIGLLQEIQQYLEKLTSPFVRLQVTNPQFEEVQFDFEVTFLPNHDITFYTNQLNNDLEQFLTPWANETAKDIEFGGKIEKSVVLNYVEERAYVDFVTCFTMNQFVRDENNAIVQQLYNIEKAVASTARSVLVSYKDENTGTRHLITSPANCNCHG